MRHPIIRRTLSELADALMELDRAEKRATQHIEDTHRASSVTLLFSKAGYYVECGACGFFHAIEFAGDCRQEAARGGCLLPVEILWHDTGARIDTIDDAIMWGGH